MQRIAARARKISRTLYASLPMQYRVARLLIQLKVASEEEIYGRAIYAEFIKAGVTDMPDVNDAPALDLQEKLIRLGSRAASALPRGYGRKFGVYVWAFTQKTLGSFAGADAGHNVIASVVADLSEGSKAGIKAVPLKSAEAYVRQRLAWRAKDYVDSSMRGHMTHETHELPTQLVDESSLEKAMAMLDPHDLPKLKARLRRIDPKSPDRAWDFIESKLQGYDDVELAEKWGVTGQFISWWVKQHRNDLKKVFTDFI